MFAIINRRISTKTGIIVLLLVAAFVGSMIIRQYKNLMEKRFEVIEKEIFEQP
jgi:hypothetical protein